MNPLAPLALLALALSPLPHGAGYPAPPPPAGGSSGGPGDTVPPGPTPSPPGPSGPTSGGPAAPAGPATGPGPAPKAPIPASTGGVAPGGSAVPTGARTGTVAVPTGGLAVEETSWEPWWYFNRHAWLDLKQRVEDTANATGADGSAPAAATVDRGLSALATALASERQRDLLSSALVGLARACDGDARARSGEFAGLIERFLADPDQEVAETSAAALGILLHDASVAQLASVLHDEAEGRRLTGGERVPVRTRAFAAFALGLAGARSDRDDLRAFAALHLLRALDESAGARAADVPAACVLALGLVPLPDVGDADLPASRGARAQVERGTRAAEVARLIEVLRDEDRPAIVRAHVPDAVARLCADARPELRETAVRVASEILQQGRVEAEVQRGAALALGRLADADGDEADVRARATLRRALEARDVQVRLYALVGLAQAAARPGTGAGVDAARAEVRGQLVERLARGKSRERAWAALAVGILERAVTAEGEPPSRTACENLQRALREAGSSDQVAALCLGLGLARDTSATPLLLKRLGDTSDPTARGHIATALGLLGDAAAIPPLRALLPRVRYQPDLLREVAIGLALCGDRGLVPELLAALREAKSLSSQASIARAIGFAGDLSAVDPLVRMLEDRTLTAQARSFAAVAIGLVCDRERVPWNARLSIGVNYRAATATLADGSAGILDIL